MNLDLFKRDLIRDEGKSLKLYKDSKGIWTIGIGHNIQDKGISEAICNAIFEEDIFEPLSDLDTHIPWWRNIDEVRKRVLANMCFNMGWTVFSEFKNFLAAVQNGNYTDAAEHMKNSLWAKEVGIRAERLEHMMLTGQDP